MKIIFTSIRIFNNFPRRVKIASYFYRGLIHELLNLTFMTLARIFPGMKITRPNKGRLIARKLTLFCEMRLQFYYLRHDPLIDENRNVNDWQWWQRHRNGRVDMQNSQRVLRSAAPMIPRAIIALPGNSSLINVLFNFTSLTVSANTRTISCDSVRCYR